MCRTITWLIFIFVVSMALSSTFSRLNLFPKPSFIFHRSWKPLLLNRSSKLLPPTTSSSSPSSLNSFTAYCSILTSENSTSIAPKNPFMKAQDDLIVLGIETSCDDTAAAVFSCSLFDGALVFTTLVRTGQKQRRNSQSSCVLPNLLALYGGVAPKMAEEAHSQVIDQVVQQALDKANLSASDLSAVAVTIGPGLSLCLRVGVRKARKVASSFNLPMVGVHHMEAHALVARLTERDLQFPFLALLISGGHNLLVLARDLGHYIQLGTSIDDAIGEAYDKTAKWLGLDLRRSGGPAIEELAREGDAHAIKFSTPMKQHKDCNFSYAGLKTQVKLAIESKNVNAAIPISSASSEDRSSRADIAASFQRVAVLHLEERCQRAIEWALKIEPSIKHLVVSGGVASNQYVRAQLDQVVKKNNLHLVCPPPSLCTDNGVMVAWTGIEHFRVGRFDPAPPAEEPEDFVYDLRPRWPLGEEYAEGKSEARSLRTARIHPSLTSIIQASLQQQP
ncbi:probable tRNA N6-adenosine threonylcarbamoyltransferase, mitochondrial isoform X1 [Cannabis sativa]|uniref:probable tRNA N6-adenosine threonylcarbamoyltransferase, mitochondrial isoform X1 n=1 Tax=Cannabis sativa TaxID=3483 RepID=UPI0029CA106C|nr:probable tRNA N6-adenosine threonylcarbamoyltransferase, mitochondrial isoform X1 [Cannabis sativa]